MNSESSRYTHFTTAIRSYRIRFDFSFAPPLIELGEYLPGEPGVPATPADSPLLEDGEVPLETLSSLPLIGYRGCRTEERVVSYLRGLGIGSYLEVTAPPSKEMQDFVDSIRTPKGELAWARGSAHE